MCDQIAIKNINVVDPFHQTIEKKDLYVADGIFIDEGSIKRDRRIRLIEGMNYYAAPGFIDMHVHVFEDKTSLGIRADKVGVEQAVSKIVDAGSTGIRDFGTFKEQVIDKSLTDVYYFLNIARKGLVENLSELADPTDLMTGEELANFMQQHGENLVGLKVRMSGSVVKESGISPLIHARELSDKSGLPLMIHIGNAPPNLSDVLNLLKKGDIVTHVFHGKEGGIPYYPKEYEAAVKRGVHFDVGHGNASFSYQTVDKVTGIADIDYSISTDIYKMNYVSPVESLMTTMSKFFPFHLPLEEIIYKVTALPGRVLKIPVEEIKYGNNADITIFRVIEGEREFIDSEGCIFKTKRYLKPCGTIKKGKVMWIEHV